MKKNFTIADGLFLLFVYFKLNHSGPALTWLEVFAPYIAEVIYKLAAVFVGAFSFTDKIKFWFWKKAIAWRALIDARRAKKFVSRKFNEGQKTARSGNPGRVIDHEKEGQ